jgi:FtsP/CotA-like multicopper oxidase with cupredoxin domain
MRFKLQVQRGSREFYPGAASSTLGYNGDYLGPTIRVRRGDTVRIDVENRLEETTTVHWHGAHVPAEMDGGPHQQIPPGTVWSAEFPVRQQAATLWYHPHLIPTTAEQVYRGLAGLMIIEDENSASLPIPQEYGQNDIPLILQERRFRSDGRFIYRPSRPDVMHGYAGNAILANGALKPYLEVGREVIRLRLLNGSNSSVLRIALEGQRPFLQIASDGGFLEQPVELRTVVLSPGERAALLLDFSRLEAGERPGLTAQTNAGASYRVLQFRLRGASGEAGPRAGREIPYPDTSFRLNRIDPISAPTADRSRRFVMSTMGPGGQLTINGKRMDMDRIDERVPLGATEIWQIEHGQGMMGRMMNVPHSFHVHDGQFQILSINDRAPPAPEGGWKDTVLLWPGDVIRIIKRFEEYTGIYMYHCIS